MARERNPNREKAKEMYLAAKGNIKLIDISNKLNVLDTQIRKWKSQDKWEQELNGTLPKEKVQMKRNEKERKEVKKVRVKDTISKEVKEVMKNNELTDKQKLFCIYYTKCFNATKAYMKAYDCCYATGATEGNKNLKKPHIKAQIERLTEIVFDKASLTKALIQKYIDIAFADITDYVTFGQEEYEVKGEDGKTMIDEDGNIVTRQYSYVKPNESIKVDGSLISEVSQGKDGIKIKLADKMKAMDFLNKHCNLLNDEEKTKLELENKRLQNEKMKEEIKKVTGEDEPEIEDDGFMAALNEKTVEVWTNEE